MSELHPVVIPDRVWDDFLNPDVSEMEQCLGMTALRGEPFLVKRGKGGQRHYRDVPRQTVLDLAEYLYDRGDLLLGQGVTDPYDPFEKAARDVLRRAIKLADELRKLAA